MRPDDINNQQEAQREPQSRPGYDPIEAAWSNMSAISASWLKNGASLSLIQRVGYALMSLMFVGAGVYLFVDSFESFQVRGAGFVFSAPGSLFFLGVGLMGLRNVLRFKRDSPAH
jgi:hypothetical protein